MRYKMKNLEKYGFVYIWFDRKHKRYYIGCHWGTEDDGYLCSSNWMRDAYKRRPQDFKRRILKSDLSRIEMYEEEQRYLNMIKPEEVKIRYYNLKITKDNPWHKYPENIKKVSEKISIKTKEAMQRPEIKEKHKNAIRNRDTSYINDPSYKEKLSKSLKEAHAITHPVENRKKVLKKGSKELSELLSNKSKEMWKKKTTEEKERLSKITSEKNKNLKSRLGHINTEEHNKKISESNKIYWNNLSEEQKQNRVNKIVSKTKGQKRTKEQNAFHSIVIKEIWEKRRQGLIPMPKYNSELCSQRAKAQWENKKLIINDK